MFWIQKEDKGSAFMSYPSQAWNRWADCKVIHPSSGPVSSIVALSKPPASSNQLQMDTFNPAHLLGCHMYTLWRHSRTRHLDLSYPLVKYQRSSSWTKPILADLPQIKLWVHRVMKTKTGTWLAKTKTLGGFWTVVFLQIVAHQYRFQC